MRKQTVEAWKRCPKCGKTENQIKAGYNGSGSQRCKCKECGIYYTINPKRHEYPEETRKLAIKMYYGGVSGRGVGKILQMNKSNVMNWIKKERKKGSWKVQNSEHCGTGWAILVSGIQAQNGNPGKRLSYNHGKPETAADHGACCEPGQVGPNDPTDGGYGTRKQGLLYRRIQRIFGRGLSGEAHLQYPQQEGHLHSRRRQLTLLLDTPKQRMSWQIAKNLL